MTVVDNKVRPEISTVFCLLDDTFSISRLSQSFESLYIYLPSEERYMKMVLEPEEHMAPIVTFGRVFVTVRRGIYLDKHGVAHDLVLKPINYSICSRIWFRFRFL